jgi:hypothetical protein
LSHRAGGIFRREDEDEVKRAKKNALLGVIAPDVLPGVDDADLEIGTQ